MAFRGYLGRMVIDKTGVKELIDIPEQTFEVGPDASNTDWVPPVLKKIGFDFESGRAFVEALIIDRIEKRSEN
jgi:hypothetical protein